METSELEVGHSCGIQGRRELDLVPSCGFDLRKGGCNNEYQN